MISQLLLHHLIKVTRRLRAFPLTQTTHILNSSTLHLYHCNSVISTSRFINLKLSSLYFAFTFIHATRQWLVRPALLWGKREEIPLTKRWHFAPKHQRWSVISGLGWDEYLWTRAKFCWEAASVAQNVDVYGTIKKKKAKVGCLSSTFLQWRLLMVFLVIIITAQNVDKDCLKRL